MTKPGAAGPERHQRNESTRTMEPANRHCGHRPTNIPIAGPDRRTESTNRVPGVVGADQSRGCNELAPADVAIARRSISESLAPGNLVPRNRRVAVERSDGPPFLRKGAAISDRLDVKNQLVNDRLAR
jgi:hypothetical protein